MTSEQIAELAEKLDRVKDLPKGRRGYTRRTIKRMSRKDKAILMYSLQLQLDNMCSFYSTEKAKT